MSSITGRDVRRVRKVLDVSQQKLAAMLYMSTVTISRWEGERTCPDGYGEVVIQLLLDLDMGSVLPDDVLRELRLASGRKDVVTRLVLMCERYRTAA